MKHLVEFLYGSRLRFVDKFNKDQLSRRVELTFEYIYKHLVEKAPLLVPLLNKYDYNIAIGLFYWPITHVVLYFESSYIKFEFPASYFPRYDLVIRRHPTIHIDVKNFMSTRLSRTDFIIPSELVLVGNFSKLDPDEILKSIFRDLENGIEAILCDVEEDEPELAREFRKAVPDLYKFVEEKVIQFLDIYKVFMNGITLAEDLF